jgi:hypothetical protein
MSIKTASVLVDGTVAVTAGTATTMIAKSSTDKNTVVILDDSSEYLNQTEMVFKTTEPRVNTGAPNGYTQARGTVKIKAPLVLDNGGRTVNSVSVEIATDIETTDAERTSLRKLAVQAIMDADFDAFWNQQALD